MSTEPRRLPRHVGIIMDGNGRWAKHRGLERTEGHAMGEEALFDVVDGALDIGLDWLTVYAFSTENWRRPPSEVRYLMGFNRRLLQRRRDELNDRGARILFTGRVDKVWGPMESLYEPGMSPIPRWDAGIPAEQAKDKVNELILPDGRKP